MDMWSVTDTLCCQVGTTSSRTRRRGTSSGLAIRTLGGLLLGLHLLLGHVVDRDEEREQEGEAKG